MVEIIINPKYDYIEVLDICYTSKLILLLNIWNK